MYGFSLNKKYGFVTYQLSATSNNISQSKWRGYQVPQRLEFESTDRHRSRRYFPKNASSFHTTRLSYLSCLKFLHNISHVKTSPLTSNNPKDSFFFLSFGLLKCDIPSTYCRLLTELDCVVTYSLPLSKQVACGRYMVHNINNNNIILPN